METSWKIWTKKSSVNASHERANIAARFGILHVFKEKLLQDQEIVSCEGEFHEMPLNYAVRGGHLELVQFLLDSPLLLSQLRSSDSSEAESSSPQSSTLHSTFRRAIFDAVDRGSAAMVDVLVKFCVREKIQAESPSFSPYSLLHKAIKRGPSICRALLGQRDTAEGSTKATISEIGLQFESNRDLKSLLEIAVVLQNHTAIALLSGIEANMDAHWAETYTRLYQAVSSGDLKALITLVDHEARAKVISGDHSLILCAARFSDNPGVVRYLIDTLHQNPNFKDESGELPVYSALSWLDSNYLHMHNSKGREECVKILLEKLDVSNPQRIYRRVLIHAADDRKWDLVRFVAARKDLDKGSRNDCMVTWLKSVHPHGNSSLCKALLDIDTVSEQERIDEATTWLKLAHSRENFSMCQALLDMGAVPEPDMMPKGMKKISSGRMRAHMLGHWYWEQIRMRL